MNKFNDRFNGKHDFVTKDGHYGIVKNTKNPILKDGMDSISRNFKVNTEKKENSMGPTGTFGQKTGGQQQQ
jgi:hypothetical protein